MYTNLKRWSPQDWAFGLLLLWSGAATTLSARRIFARRATSSSAPPIANDAHVRDWKAYDDGGYVVGPPPADAAATIVVFSDFECPYCRRFAATIDSLHLRRADVRIVERHFPIVEIHPEAFAAALAGECAKELGLYGAMREIMFQRRGLVADNQWGLLGARAGVRDTAALVNCVEQRRHAVVVQRDIEAGLRLGVRGTPTILVNDRLHAGALDLTELEGFLKSSAQRR